MKYLRDSNTAINIMRHPQRAAATRFLSLPPSDLATSIIVKAELCVGPNRKKSHSTEPAKLARFLSRVKILPFDDNCAEEFGRLAAHVLDAGTPVGALDVQIGATARAFSLIVVTRNAKDFGKLPGIQIENWITDSP